MGLSELGISQFISSINPSDGSQASNVCSKHYETARDQALTDIGPRWATNRKALALVGETLVSNWGYVYQYPSDCLNIHLLVVPGTRQPLLGQSIPYEVANYNGSIAILCDQPDMEIIYTSRVTNTGLFDAKFCFALANLIGSRAAVPLAKGELAQSLLQGYYALASEASARSQNEANAGEPPISGLEAFRS